MEDIREISIDNKIHDKQRLKELQALSLDRKILITQARIIEWYKHYNGQVYVSFSGGKDSTVLLYLVRQLFPDVEAVFIDTGLEYPEIRDFVKAQTNVTWIKPKMKFREVLSQYGYPVISKEVADKLCYARRGSDWAIKCFDGLKANGEASAWGENYKRYKYLIDAPFDISADCCTIMKKEPAKQFEKQTGKRPFIGTMAADSCNRKNAWLKNGCNAFDSERPKSTPMSFWKDQDVIDFIAKYSIPYCSVYGELQMDKKSHHTEKRNNLRFTGTQHTGCMFCAFGAHLDRQPNRFQRMANTYPKIYEYCMKPFDKGGLGLADILSYIGCPYLPYEQENKKE